MNLRARPYRDPTDLVRMRQLLIAGRQATSAASSMHPGYLDFDTHCPPDESENRRDFQLWEGWDANDDQPTLDAWAMYWRNEDSFDLFVSPALYGTPVHEAVMDEYVAWAEARAREAGLKQIAPFWAMDYDKVLGRDICHNIRAKSSYVDWPAGESFG